jgi:hypothetical protein
LTATGLPTEAHLAQAFQSLLENENLSPGERERTRIALQRLDPKLRSQNTVFHFQEEGLEAFAEATYYTGGFWLDSLPGNQAFAFGNFEPAMQATYGEHLTLSVAASVGMERNHRARFTETYDPFDGLPYNTDREGKLGNPRGVSTFDGFRAMLGLREGRFLLELGQDWNVWGPGRSQHLTFGNQGYFWSQDSLPPAPSLGFEGSQHPERFRRGYRFPGESPPLPQLRFRYGGAQFSYIKTVAQRQPLWKDSSAWLVGHRLAWHPTPHFTLAGTEWVAVAGRTPDALYWLPLVPLKFAEHQFGDQDNIALSVDFDWRFFQRAHVYGEWLLDDYSGPPFGFWGNKFGLLFGVEWGHPWGLPGTLGAEFSRTDPWLFTHHRPGNALQNGGALLGSVLPPHALSLQLMGKIDLGQNWQTGFHTHWRWRNLESAGSSPLAVHDPISDSDQKEFLEGTVEKRFQFLTELTWDWRRYAQILGQAGWQTVSTWKGVEGKSTSGPLMTAQIRLNY